MAMQNLGRVTGLSAYEVWLNNGNTGTEQEFLASLKGDKGDTGTRGETGDTGPAGGPGPAGANGADGYSPSAKVEQTDTGATITITDKNGTTTAEITNGKDGTGSTEGLVTTEQLEEELYKKQDTLVSGTNIKTINGESILGEGNINIEGVIGGGSSTKTTLWEGELTATNENITFSQSLEDFDYLLIEATYVINSLTRHLPTTMLDTAKVKNTYGINQRFPGGIYVNANYTASSLKTFEFVQTMYGFESATKMFLHGVNKTSDVTSCTVTKVVGVKLQGGSSGSSESIILDTEMSDTSENAVQNKVIKAYVDENIPKLVTLTQAEYDALVNTDTVDDNTYYFIKEG